VQHCAGCSGTADLTFKGNEIALPCPGLPVAAPPALSTEEREALEDADRSEDISHKSHRTIRAILARTAAPEHECPDCGRPCGTKVLPDCDCRTAALEREGT
jgi:hypothetical protein